MVTTVMAEPVDSETKRRFENYVALTGEKVFLMDAEEVLNGAYGYSMTEGIMVSFSKN